VLHLLYARFWHKVLYDLGFVSTPEPFRKLVNQGIILGETEFHVFQREDGTHVSTEALHDVVEEAGAAGATLVAVERATGARCLGRRIGEDQVERLPGGGYALKSDPAIRVDARSFKMSKSRGNVVNPDEIVREYGADAFRLYEMYLGPLEASKPWNTRDIVGMSRFLNSVWRHLVGDDESGRRALITDAPPAEALDRQMHRTIKKVGEDIQALRFNTAIAELIKLNNELTGLSAVPRSLARTLTLLLAPFAPHIAEEIWERLGHTGSLAREPWPVYDPAKLAASTIELPVQINGKVRDRLTVPADASEATVLELAMVSEKVRPWVAGKTVKSARYVPGRLVSIAVKEN
jgi:leucyl-tRNA synthetase